MARAAFAFSADPITHGHLALLRRAVALFGSVQVWVADNTQKRHDLSLDRRLALCRAAFASLPGIKVDPLRGLLADGMAREGCDVLVRGIRGGADLEYESQLEAGNRSQGPGFDTVYLLPDPSSRHISSSLSKVILREMGDLRPYVPIEVKRSMEEDMLGQFRLTVTGPIAAGKSHLTRRLLDWYRSKGIEASEIDMDEATSAVWTSRHPGIASAFARDLEKAFGSGVIGADGRPDKGAVRRIVFGDEAALARLGEIIRLPLENEFRSRIRERRGLVFLAAAVACEHDWTWHSNHRVLLVDADPAVRLDRLMRREKIDEAEAGRRLAAGGSGERRKLAWERWKDRDGAGEMREFRNDAELDDARVESLATELLELFPALRRGAG